MSETARAATPGLGNEEGYDADAAAIRDVAKWLAAPLAGLGLVLSSGLRVGDVAALGDYLPVAISAAPIGAVGLAIGLGFTGMCLLPPRRAYETVVSRKGRCRRFAGEAERQGLLPRSGEALAYIGAVDALSSCGERAGVKTSMEELCDIAKTIDTARLSRRTATDGGAVATCKALTGLPAIVPMLEAAAHEAKAASERAELGQSASRTIREAHTYLDGLLGRLSSFAAYYVTRERFRRAIIALIVGAIIAAASLAIAPVIAYLAGHADSASALSSVSPVRVWLGPEDRSWIVEREGVLPGCVPAPGEQVFAVGGSWDAPVLLVPHRPGRSGEVECRPYMYEVAGEGTVTEPVVADIP